MNSAELRIGNYTLRDGELFVIEQSDHIDIANALQGVPLDENWFDGFDFYSHSPWIHSVDLSEITGLIFKGDNKSYKCSLLVRNSISGNQLFPLTEIKFVHQLQNLCFAIIGAEIKFNKPFSKT